RVAAGPVLVAATQPAEAVVVEGRDLVDGRDHRAGRRVRVLAGVDGPRREAGGAPVGRGRKVGHALMLDAARRRARRRAAGAAGAGPGQRAPPAPARRPRDEPGTGGPAVGVPRGRRPEEARMLRSQRVPPDRALASRDASPFAVPATHAVLGTPLAGPWPEGTAVIHLALGCFWGAEKAFWQTSGV